MTEPITYLQVQRIDDETDGSCTYLYRLPDGTYPERRSTESRLHLESNLEVAARWLRPPGTPADHSRGQESFTELGDELSMRYLPEPVLAYLFDHQSPLLIETDDPEFPWELVRHQGQILGLFRSIGRTLPILRRDPPGLDRWGNEPHALLVATESDALPMTQLEISQLRQRLETHVPPCTVEQVPDYAEDRPTRARMAQLLQYGSEFLHVAGHLLYDTAHKGASGLQCADGLVLTADEIRALKGTYAYVCLNGCRGARAAQSANPALQELRPNKPGSQPGNLNQPALQEQGGLLSAWGDQAALGSSEQFQSLGRGARVVNGLATAFLEGGASAFISTLWPIMDDRATEWSRVFYNFALDQGLPLGEALRQVRLLWRKQAPQDPTWAGYILYGNPLMTLAGVRDPAGMGRAALNQVEHAVAAVSLHASAFQSNARTRQREESREERFFRRFFADERLTLGPSGTAVLSETLRWLDQMQWHQMARLDLLVGLARVHRGFVERGLLALGRTPQQLCDVNGELFGRGKKSAPQPDVTEGVYRALRRAAHFAVEQGRTSVEEADLAAGLLDLAGTGSLQIGLERLGLEPRQLLQASLHADVNMETRTPDSEAAGAVASPEQFLSGNAMGAEGAAGDHPIAYSRLRVQVLTPAEEVNAKRDVTPRQILRDLKAEIEDARRDAGPPPFVGRLHEMRETLRVLTRPSQPNVLLRGPAGTGVRALAYALAVRVVTRPDAADVAAIKGWDLFAVRTDQKSQKAGEWLREEVLDQVQRPTLLILEDLPHLLSYEGVPQLFQDILTHPGLRCVATLCSEDYRLAQQRWPQFLPLFTIIDIPPATPEAALLMVEAQVDRLERKHKLTIDDDAPKAAITCWGEERGLALPGAALTRLERACVRTVETHGGPDTPSTGGSSGDPQPGSGSASGESPAPAAGVSPIRVTAEAVRTAGPV